MSDSDNEYFDCFRCKCDEYMDAYNRCEECENLFCEDCVILPFVDHTDNGITRTEEVMEYEIICLDCLRKVKKKTKK